MFYEILNLRAPNVSNFAEALKVADPSTFKDSWKLADGFVAAEGKNKSPVVPFHEIPSQYSQFKEIRIFAPIQQGTEKT